MIKKLKQLFFEPQNYNRELARREHVWIAIAMVLLAAFFFALHAYGGGK